MEMQNIFNAQNPALTLSGLNEQTRQLQSMQGFAAGNQGCESPPIVLPRRDRHQRLVVPRRIAPPRRAPRVYDLVF
jgi:hypothetical protein